MKKKTWCTHKLTNYTNLHPQGRTKANYIATLISDNFFFCDREGMVDGPSFSDAYRMLDVGCWEGEGPIYCHSHHTAPLCVPAN